MLTEGNPGYASNICFGGWGISETISDHSTNEKSFLARNWNLNSNRIKIPRLILLTKSAHRNY